MSRPGGTLVVVQGGGPTPVFNASLYGVITEAHQHFDSILGSRFGIEGLLKNELINLKAQTGEELERLKMSPGAALGSTRYKASDDDLERVLQGLKRRDVRSLIIIGGNGSLRGADAIAKAATDSGYGLSVIGVPKTIDNDINGTDRCPGFASAARYVAQAVRDLGMDVRTLPQPVSIFETMGRSVGWLAGATVLGKLDEDHAPHLVYLPERAFEVERFLGDLDRVVRKLGWAVVVVNEGIKDASGKLVYETADASQRDAMDRALPGGVGTYLAEVVTQRLKIRCRCEKPGLCGRASMLHVSRQDLIDAELVGRAGVQALLNGENAKMVSLRPLDIAGEPWELAPLARAYGDRPVPQEWLTDSDTAVDHPFVRYVQRIVGDLVEYAVPLTARARARDVRAR